MNTQEVKKAKRRKNKVAAGKSYSAASIPQKNEVTEIMTEENGDAERIARIMDAADETEIMAPFNRGPNPFLDREKCLLCGVDRTERTSSSSESSVTDDAEKHDSEGQTFEQLPVWVCQSCRRTADGDLNRKIDLKSVAEIPMPALSLNPGQDMGLDSASLGMLGDFTMFPSTGEPLLANGTVCTCDSCMERRQITQEHEQETKTLQTVWTSLRTMVRKLYAMEITSLSEDDAATFRGLVEKLCSRDPHQLFQRLESQVREFVIEKKVNLRKKINAGYSTPPQAREIMSMLLEEYSNLSSIARIVSENLSTLKDHLRRFNVTWELHNKHLYHSIVYTEPAIQGCLDTLCEQLRNGALDKESYTEDTYPNLMKRFVGFRNEMSVIMVLWHDCQQLIDRYNEEQTALKVKQKWLKEDWEFFKAQRKILEQQVLKNNPKATMSHSMEAQFTETMRNMLTGQKPPAEESHCPRCSRKRCPCDECTITHMITCGIINPEQLETNGTHHTFNFPHDSNRYVIDVTPPSMSSTTSSSASSSPVPLSRELATHHVNSCNLSSRNNRTTEENGIRMDEGADNEDEDDEYDEDNEDKDEEDNEDDEDEEDEEDDDGDDEEDDEGDVDEEEDDDDDDDHISEDQKDFDAMLASGKLGLPTAPVVVPTAESIKLLGAMCQQHIEPTEDQLGLSDQDFSSMPPPCACHHCVLPTQPEPRIEVGAEETPCQCHICLQQRGQTVSTTLPTSLPLPPRPAQLHLYPHIHGTLPPAAHPHLHLPHSHVTHPMHNHMPHTLERSLLQPQLYNLHGPRMPFKLDFDDPDAIQDHLLNAYGDWDNSSYDSSRMLGPSSHHFSSSLSPELLPPPPMTADAAFSVEALSPSVMSASHAVSVSHALLGSSGVAATTSSAFKAVAAAGFATGIPPAFQIPVDSVIQDQAHSITTSSQPTSSVPELNLNLCSASLSTFPINFSTSTPSSVSLPLAHNPPPCTRPVTLGGNGGTLPPHSKEKRTYAQPCKKYSMSSQNSILGVSNKMDVIPPPPPPSSQSHANLGVASFANGVQSTTSKATSKSQRQSLPNSETSHACTHAQYMLHGSTAEGNADNLAGLNTCASSTAPISTINNVSVGTSTLCTDPDCQSHHDDNCDSIDDSCSEKSSSTSASNNQKEGKYCDCCYCEFFGHGNPPVAQTSKNFAEMRERLRRRLKQRNEAKQDRETTEGQSESQHAPVSMKDLDLDALLNFINGTDSDGAKTDPQQSSKAAKRARQKQRKAEERMRREEEERRQKLAAQRRLEAEKMSSNSNSGSQKKKGKHKEDKRQKAVAAVGSGCTSGNDVLRDSRVKSCNKGKQRLKDNHHENQAEKNGGRNSQEIIASNGKIPAMAQVMPTTASNGRMNKDSWSVASVINQVTKKPVDMFQPPAHLLRSLPEQSVQQTTKSSALSSTTSPSPLPTLGGQPNSPTAKKAKRRLAPNGTQGQPPAQRKLILQQPQDPQQADLQRKMEAKQEVARQMLEAEEFARQQTQLRKQLHHQEMLAQQKQHAQQQQHQQKMASQKQQQHHVPQKEMINLRQAAGKANSLLTQSSKVTSNGVAGQHLSINTNHGKLVNGIGASNRVFQPTMAAIPSCGSEAVYGKLLSPGTNGIMPLESQVHTASMVKKNNAEQQQEQVKSAKGKNKKKKKANQDLAVDEVFLPRPVEELESNDMDEADRDIERFKRFVMENPTPPRERQKLDFNLNMKDIFSKKKSGLGCI